MIRSMRVRAWSLEEFASSHDAWDRLLSTADADRLFMSWDWQWLWWKHHGAAVSATLRILAVYSAEGALVGIAPLYSRTVSVRGLFRVCRLEIMGIVWRHSHAIFSDYLDLIIARGYEDAVLAQIAEWLAAESFWQELAFCCTRPDGAADRLIRSYFPHLYVRDVDPLNAWSARLPAQFPDYVARLDSAVRRRLFRHRTRLIEPRMVSASTADIAPTLALLHKWSAERWSVAYGDDPFLSFHLELAARMASTGQLRLTVLATQKGPLSVMYNIRAGRTVYYLKSAFDPEPARGLSVGYLHFGYAIEAACVEGADYFDVLAGPGRHRDYKRDLLTERVPVVTYHAVRKPLPRALYAAYDAVRRATRRPI